MAVQKAREQEAKAAEARRTDAARQAEAASQAEARRRTAARADAESAFRTLLSEVVKDPSKAWIDVKVSPNARAAVALCAKLQSLHRLERGGVCAQDKLKGDVLKRMASQLLDPEDYVALFEEHTAALLAQARQQYLAALDGAVKPVMLSEGAVKPRKEWGEVARDFEAAAEVLAAHVCFLRLTAVERRATWQRYVHDVAHGAPNPGAPKVPIAAAPPGPSGPPPSQAPLPRRFDDERDRRPRERAAAPLEDRERGSQHWEPRGRDAGRDRGGDRNTGLRRHVEERRRDDRLDEGRGRRGEERERGSKRPRR